MWKKTRPYVLPMLGVVIFGALLALTARYRIEKLKANYQLYAAPPLSSIKTDFIRVLLLGHKAIYDDFIAVWLLQTLLDPAKLNDPDRLMEQIRSVIRHEPKLETTYMLSCFVMLNDAKRPEHCQEIILAGLRAFPDSWRLPMTQAYVEFAVLNHPAQAASFFMMAASRPQSPPYVQKAAKKLLETKALTEEDLAKSMELIADSAGSDAFKKLLESVQKTHKPSPTTP